MLKNNESPFKPVDKNGKPMVMEGNIYKSKETGESINIEEITKSIDSKTNKLNEVRSLSVDTDENIIIEEPIKFEEENNNIDDAVDKDCEAIPYEDMFFEDGNIKANQKIFTQIKEKLKNNQFISLSEMNYYNKYKEIYEPYYANENSLYHIDVPEIDNIDEEFYDEEPEEYKYHFADEADDYYDLEYEEELRRKKRLRQIEDDLTLLYFEHIGY